MILGRTYATHLKKLVAKAAKADPEYEVFGASSHKYRLNPVISIEKVRQFENEFHLTLPEEKEQILYFLKDCSCKKAADLVAYAESQQINSNIRRTAVYVMESCVNNK